MNLPVKQMEILMRQDMSRKEFLQVIGVGILGIIGVTTLLQNLRHFAEVSSKQKPANTNVISGYGSTPYGR